MDVDGVAGALDHDGLVVVAVDVEVYAGGREQPHDFLCKIGLP